MSYYDTTGDSLELLQQRNKDNNNKDDNNKNDNNRRSPPISISHDDVEAFKRQLERNYPGKLDGVKQKFENDDNKIKKVDIDVDVHGVPKRQVDIDISRQGGNKKKIDVDIDIDLHRPSKRIHDIHRNIDIDVPDYWPYPYWPYAFPYTYYVEKQVQPVQQIYQNDTANSLVGNKNNMTIAMVVGGVILLVAIMMVGSHSGGGGGGGGR